MARIVSLEDARSFGEGWLQERVFDVDPEVRRQAVLALGRIGRPEAVEPLVAALVGDEAGAVRSTAAFALGILEDPLPEEALGALRAAAGERSGRVREKAVEAIGSKGGSAGRETVLARLADLVAAPGFADRREDTEASRRRTSWDEARLALFALARLGTPAEGSGPEVVAVFERDEVPRTNWWAAAWSAATLADPALLSSYRVWAGSPDPVIQALGVRGLGRAASEAEFADGVDLGGALTPLLNHPDGTVRIEALLALAALARAGHDLPAEAGARLVAALDDPDPLPRRAALAGLAIVRHPSAVPMLIDWTLDADPETRAGAFRALHHQDEEGFRLLMSGWSDPDPVGRAALARQLAGIRDPRVLEFLLRALLPDEDPRVRTAALEGVGRIGSALAAVGADPDPGAVRALESHLTAEDSLERAAAATALGRLGAHRAELRRRAADDQDPAPWLRLAALRVALEAGGNGAVEAARASLGDPAWPVRAEAHRFLRRHPDPAPAPPLPAVPLDPSDYDAMLHAPFTPVAWIDTDRGEIEVELFIGDAPRTVWRFMRRAREGVYDGQRLARPLPGSAVYAGNARSASADLHRSEINERTFMRGSLGLEEEAKDTGGDRFFITLLPAPERNGRTTLFGHVRRGFEVLERIESGDRIRRVRIWDGITPPDP